MSRSCQVSTEHIARYADMFSAMGTEPRLRIMQLLLTAHPEGLVVGDIQDELDIPNSTLSHHLDKLKSEDLVRVRRESTFLRYTANTQALEAILQFLYAECCTRKQAVQLQQIALLGGVPTRQTSSKLATHHSSTVQRPISFVVRQQTVAGRRAPRNQRR